MRKLGLAPLALSILWVGCGPPTPRGGDDSAAGGPPDAGVASDAGTAADAGSQPSADGGNVAPSSNLVDPNCLDGQYRESLPDPSVSLAALTADYSSENWRQYVEGALRARFPQGWNIVSEALRQAPPQLGDCLNPFVGRRGSAAEVDRQLSTFVHECGHFLDIGLGMRGGDVFFVTSALTISCQNGDAPNRGGRTFARSRIRGDDHSDERPPCGGGGGRQCDSYADTYLDGDPDDNRFQGGDQGFNSLMEEAFQYVNSLAVGYAFNDRYRFTVSERDGILTHLWWVERFLRYARQEYPEAHTFLLGSACWRRAILTLWGRSWLYLEASEDMNNLGISADAIEDLVMTPVLLDEIEAVRAAHGCR